MLGKKIRKLKKPTKKVHLGKTDGDAGCKTVKPVSLREIAERAGVTRTTVSLALRKHPRISIKTRDRIKVIADDLGYCPNPELTKVMALMGRKAYSEGVIGFIRSGSDKEWDTLEKIEFSAATKHAKKYGYRVEPFSIFDTQLTPAKVNLAMWSQGIEGVIIPMIHPVSFDQGVRTLPVDWDKFCVVEIADTITEQNLTGVRHDHFAGMMRALSELEALGYKRIGFCMESCVDLRTHHRWTAAYLLWRNLRGFSNDLEPYLPDKYNGELLAKWAEKESLDAVVSPGIEAFRALEELDISFPEDLGFVTLDRWGEDSEAVTGIDQDLPVQVEIAVDMLIGLIHRQARGLLEHPIFATDPGRWYHGKTTRPPDANHKVSIIDNEPIRFSEIR